MRLLFINQHYPPDSGATGRLLAQLAERLARAGHEVTVLTGRPTYEEARDRTDVPPVEILRGVRVVRLPILRRRNGAIGRAFHYLSFAVSMLLAGLRQPRPDAVMAWSSTPVFGGPAALALARFHRCPFVYGVQDVYPEIAVELGILRNPVVIRFARALEVLAWKGAERIVVIGEELARFAADRGFAPPRIAVIENWADTVTIQPRETSEFRAELGLKPEDFIVQYAGNLGRSQDLDTVLEAARLVEKWSVESDENATGADPPRRVRFLLVGSGATAPEIQRAASEVAGVTTAPYQPEERLPDVLAAADLALVPLKAGLGRYCVPSKVYSILASGRPVGAMLDAGSDVARIVEAGECGFRVNPDDPEALARETLRLAGDPDRARGLGLRGREWSEARASLETAAASYEELFEETIAHSSG